MSNTKLVLRVASKTITETEKYVRDEYPDWPYKDVKGVAYYIRVGNLAKKASEMGVELGG